MSTHLVQVYQKIKSLGFRTCSYVKLLGAGDISDQYAFVSRAKWNCVVQARSKSFLNRSKTIWARNCNFLQIFFEVQKWPIEMRRQKRLLLCTPNHWHYENKQGTIKKPYKNATRNAKKILIFPKLLDFRAFFEKSVFLENGHGRHQMVAMLIH